MTESATVPVPDTPRVATPRNYLMCRPEHFTVSYKINPWMEPDNPTDTSTAVAQWEKLRDTYLELGHTVEFIDPIAGLPDMVYTANGGFVIDGVAYGAHFAYAERQPEGPAFMDWFANNGFTVREPEQVNEGEGDFLLVGGVVLAGTGFRSALDSHKEVEEVFNREVITLRLVNPRYYHLDTAITVLDPLTDDADANIAYYPALFDEESQRALAKRFPHAIIVTEDDVAAFGLNAISDGLNVVISARATDFAAALTERGYNPIGVDLSELLLGGGGVKCCTLELRR